MAAKSITVSSEASAVLAALDRHAAERGGSAERAVLQNGTRVRLLMAGVPVGLNVYPSKSGGCKVVFDQPETPEADAIAGLLAGRPSATKAAKSAGNGITPVLPDAPCWIGSDESGKGDYFGPLVVAAVALTADNWRVLETLGVQDSKKLSDGRATSLAAEIRAGFPHEIVVIMPPRYNELWTKFGSNVNRLLAWAHARAIEQVVEREPRAVAAVADQFGDESLIRDALFKRGRELRLVQMPRAERDPAVAAASILARAEFLRRLDRLGKETGLRLPKGASAAVEAAARALVSSGGAGVLDEVAKVHFKTTQRVV
jgi:ribonuclease HIII